MSPDTREGEAVKVLARRLRIASFEDCCAELATLSAQLAETQAERDKALLKVDDARGAVFDAEQRYDKAMSALAEAQAKISQLEAELELWRKPQ